MHVRNNADKSLTTSVMQHSSPRSGLQEQNRGAPEYPRFLLRLYWTKFRVATKSAGPEVHWPTKQAPSALRVSVIETPKSVSLPLNVSLAGDSENECLVGARHAFVTDRLYIEKLPSAASTRLPSVMRVRQCPVSATIDVNGSRRLHWAAAMMVSATILLPDQVHLAELFP